VFSFFKILKLKKKFKKSERVLFLGFLSKKKIKENIFLMK